MNLESLPTEHRLSIENVQEVSKEFSPKTRRRSHTRFSVASTASLTFFGRESFVSQLSESCFIPKVVEFTMEDDIHIVPGVTEYSEEEIESYWYSSKELEVMKSENQDIIDKKSENRKNYVRTMLEHQWTHNEVGIKDEKGLRMHSRASSKRERDAANKRALINLTETLLAPV